jgi:disulfide bond formation protein DsbB
MTSQSPLSHPETLQPAQAMQTHAPKALLTDRQAALAVMLLCAAALLAAHIMEWLKLAPCELCLRQREAYWTAIPLAVCAAAATFFPARIPRAAYLLMMLGAAAAALYGAGRAVEHFGVVAHWWISACTAPKHLSLDDVLAGRAGAPLVPCDQAPKFLGISLPAYNFIYALGVAGIALAPLFSLAAKILPAKKP